MPSVICVVRAGFVTRVVRRCRRRRPGWLPTHLVDDERELWRPGRISSACRPRPGMWAENGHNRRLRLQTPSQTAPGGMICPVCPYEALSSLEPTSPFGTREIILPSRSFPASRTHNISEETRLVPTNACRTPALVNWKSSPLTRSELLPRTDSRESCAAAHASFGPDQEPETRCAR